MVHILAFVAGTFALALFSISQSSKPINAANPVLVLSFAFTKNPM